MTTGPKHCGVLTLRPRPKHTSLTAIAFRTSHTWQAYQFLTRFKYLPYSFYFGFKMRLTGSGVYTTPIPKMPDGLVELMEGISRDVLKNNPADVYEFCAEHMRKLLEIRDGSPASKPQQLEKRISKALDKIKERAEKRRVEYDLKNEQTDVPSEVVEEPKHEKVHIDPLMGDILKAPVHHEKELAEDLEVEIFRETVKVSPTIVEEEEDQLVAETGDNVISLKLIQDLNRITPFDVESNEETIAEIKKQAEELGTSIHESSGENVKETKSNENESLRKNGDYESDYVSPTEEIKSQPVLNCEDTEVLSDNVTNNTIITSKVIAKTEIPTENSQTVPQSSENLAALGIKDESIKNVDVTTDITNDATVIVHENTESEIRADEITVKSSEFVQENEQDKCELTSAEQSNENGADSPTDFDHQIEFEPEKPVDVKNVNESTVSDVNTVEHSIIEAATEYKDYDNNSTSAKTASQNNIGSNDRQSEEEAIDPSNVTVSTGTCSSLGDITTIDSSPTNVTTNMDLETAAVTIQKVFRTFMFKSRASSDDVVNDEDDTKKEQIEFTSTSPNLNRRTLGLSRMDTVLQTVNEEKSLSLSTDDSSLSSAATIIQAHVRGFLVRSKLNIHKTMSSSSLANSDRSTTSLEAETDLQKKTVLNIHIVPDGGHFISRDESLLASMDLSLDGSPPTSTNLHPMMSYDLCERRKQLKREDAIQSVSPPSNNSGKLSEDVDSVKDISIADNDTSHNLDKDNVEKDTLDVEVKSNSTSPSKSTTVETVVEAQKELSINETHSNMENTDLKASCDETDVVTPNDEKNSYTDSDVTSQLLHSGEFHDIVLPTKVFRSDTSVVREFKNVLAYFLIWK